MAEQEDMRWDDAAQADEFGEKMDSHARAESADQDQAEELSDADMAALQEEAAEEEMADPNRATFGERIDGDEEMADTADAIDSDADYDTAERDRDQNL